MHRTTDGDPQVHDETRDTPAPRRRWPEPADPVASAHHVEVVAGVLILLALLRVWLPSVIFIFGRAGSTPATTMGAFALVPFVLTVLVAPRLRARVPRTGAVAAVVMAASLLLLRLLDGGDPQLAVSTIGVMASLVWAVARLGSPRPRTGRAVAQGLVVATLFDRLAGSVDPLWSDSVTSFVLLGAVAVLLVAEAHASTGAAPDEATQPGSRVQRLALGPLLMVWALLVLPMGVSVIALGETGLGVLPLLPATLLAVLPLPREVSRPLVVVALGSGLAVVSLFDLTTTAFAVGVGALGVGVVAGVRTSLGVRPPAPDATGDVATGTDVDGATGRTIAWSLLLFFVLAFLYYATYDISFGITAWTLLAAATLLGGMSALGPARADEGLAPAAPSTPLALAATVVAVLALFGARADLPSDDDFVVSGMQGPVRVMVYNVHMGFDTRGRFALDELADVITEQGPDVVVLNEVDRGWFLNGGHDTMRLLADRTAMGFTFAPAADGIWGNAILTRLRLEDVRVEPLPRGDVPMRRSVVGATVQVRGLGDGPGDRVAIIGTHLHHVDADGGVRALQARAVADFAARYMAQGFPTVILGDMNATPGSPDLAAFAGWNDAVAMANGASGRPTIDTRTFPSWDPAEQIDHVFVSDGIGAHDLAVPRSEASDHLGVAVTLIRAR